MNRQVTAKEISAKLDDLWKNWEGNKPEIAALQHEYREACKQEPTYWLELARTSPGCSVGASPCTVQTIPQLRAIRVAFDILPLIDIKRRRATKYWFEKNLLGETE